MFQTANTSCKKIIITPSPRVHCHPRRRTITKLIGDGEIAKNMENSSRKENTNGAMQGEEIVFFVSKILHQRFFYSSSRTSGDRFWTCRTKKAGYKLGLQCQTPNRIYYLKKCILPKATKITAWLEKLRRISLLFPRNRNPDKSSSVQPLKERSPVSPSYFSSNIYFI